MMKCFKIKSIILLASQIMAALLFSGCKGTSESKSVVDNEYFIATILYTKDSTPWENPGFAPIGRPSYPKDFTRPWPYGYAGNLKCMMIRDTAFINTLSDCIKSRKVDDINTNNSFSPYFMVLLDKRGGQSVDTLAVEPPHIWFNGEVYIDSCTVKLISDQLVRYDKEYAKIAKGQYKNGKWSLHYKDVREAIEALDSLDKIGKAWTSE